MRAAVAGMALFGTAWLAACGSGPIEIGEARIVMQSAQQPVASGYLVLHNRSDRSLHLVQASSPRFEQVRLRETFTDAGRTRLRDLYSAPVPAGGDTALAPGGLLLTLYSPRQPLQAGDRVPVILTLEDASGRTWSVEKAFTVVNAEG